MQANPPWFQTYHQSQMFGAVCIFKYILYIEVTQSCPTLCDPMDYGLPGSSVHWIFQARVLEWVAIVFSCGRDIWWIINDYTYIWRRQWQPTPVLTFAWKIPWTEKPGRLQSMGLLRVGHDWVTPLSLFTFMHWRRKWKPTPVSLPGESQGQGNLMGCRLWGHTGLDTTEAT